MITTTPPTAPPTIAPVGTPLCAWSVELGPTGVVVVVPIVVAVLVLGRVEMLEPLRQERSAVQIHNVRITKNGYTTTHSWVELRMLKNER